MKYLHHVSAAYLLARDSFPRITPDEEFLLRDWLQIVEREYDEFSIDLPVGAGRPGNPDDEGAFAKMWTSITRRRVDLVAFRGSRADVVEAKLHATAPTVTQVLRYCAMFAVDHPYVTRVRPIVVCRSASPSLERLLKQHDGELHIIDADRRSRLTHTPIPIGAAALSH